MEKSTKFIFTLILISITLFFSKISGQDYSTNSIKIGMGIGASMGSNSEGWGLVYTVGYQKKIRNKRLRLNPNFSIGHYSSKFALDAADQYFNSFNFEIGFYYDLIKIKSFSLIVGCGGLLNNTSGLRGTGGYPDGNTEPQTSEYINDFHIGGSLAGGFRLNCPQSRIAINFLPVNIHYGNKYFAEFHTKLELDIKL